MRGHRHREQPRPRQCPEHAGERRLRTREFGLRDHDRAARVEQEPRVRRLLVGNRTRQRHDDRAQTDGRKLSDGECATAADDDVGPRVARRHVRMNGTHSAVTPASRRLRAMHRCAARRPGARCSAAPIRRSFASATGTPRSTRLRQGCRRRPAGAAARRDARSERRAARRRRCRRAADCPPIRRAGPRVAHGPGKAEQHAVGAMREDPVRESRDGIGSWTMSGLPVATPISAPGNDAKPPNPSTTFGRRRRMMRRLWMQAAASANGPSSNVRQPLPRMPRNARLSNSRPCCGDEPRFHAFARAEPEHATAARDQPGSRRPARGKRVRPCRPS